MFHALLCKKYLIISSSLIPFSYTLNTKHNIEEQANN